MKYMKRTKIYKASNVTFNPEKIEAHSYQWWCFVKVIKGLVIFNNYSYSMSTSRHQFKVRRLMSELGIKIDLEVSTRDSLTNYHSIEDLIIQTEEELCNKFLMKKLRQGEAYDRKKAKEKIYNEVLA
jgi:galactitol-specific phosphotransferase system IIB component